MKPIISLLAVASLFGCYPGSSSVGGYQNSFIIPDGYRGWLVIRQRTKGKPRAQNEEYRFDAKGFCLASSRFGTEMFKVKALYLSTTGESRQIPQGLYQEGSLDTKPSGDLPFFYFHGSSAEATSKPFKGEIWSFMFVGTPAEYKEARSHFDEFMKDYPLYETGSATTNPSMRPSSQ